MGNAAKKGPVPVRQQLQHVRSRVEERDGILHVTGRYHLLKDGIGLTDEYKVDTSRVLGTGVNGSVIIGNRKTDDIDVAVKPYASVGINKDDQRALRSEVEIFLALDHPHIARLLDVYEEMDKLWLVMEVCTGGEILDWICKHGSFTENKAANLMHQMLLAVNYLHSQGIVHRDIKLENFLFEDSTYSHVKLIDFGMSRYWTNNVNMKLACGTVSYIAPECLQQSYTIKCDMWSMGVVAFGLLSGDKPFSGSEQAMIAAITAGNYTLDDERGWKNVSEEAKDFVRKLMCVDVDQRMSAEEALQHPWIANRQATTAEAEPMAESTVKSFRNFAQATTFRRVAFTMMSYSMSLDDRKKVRDAFLQIDTANTGTITMAELLQVLKNQGIANDDAKSMLDSLDANDDSTIHYTEFLAAMMTHTIASNEGHIKAAFNRLDRDNSGFITLANLKATLGESYDGVDMETILKEVDTGNTGNISFEEFAAYIQGGGAELGASHQELVCKLAEEEKKMAPAAPASPAAPEAAAPASADQVAAAAPQAAPASGYEQPAAQAEAAPAAAPPSAPAAAPAAPATAAPAAAQADTSQPPPATAEPTPAKNQPTSQCCSVM